MGTLRHIATQQDIIGTSEIMLLTQRISDVRALQWEAWEWGSDIQPTETETQTDDSGAPLLVRQDGETCTLEECELVHDDGRIERAGGVFVDEDMEEEIVCEHIPGTADHFRLNQAGRDAIARARGQR